jgi:hypothetical protein
MKLGTNDIGSVYLGTNAVQKVYLGSNEVTKAYLGSTESYTNYVGPFNGSATLTTGLVSYYKFDSGANDSTGTFNCTVSGATLTTGTGGKIGECYDFDGTNDYITQNTFDMDTSNDCSINCWGKTDENGTLQLIAGQNGGSIANNSIILALSGHTSKGIQALAYHSGGVFEAVYATQPTIGTWYMWTLVKTATSLKVYQNAVEVGSAAISATINNVAYTTTPWWIGRYTGGSQEFNGLIDEICFWSKGLTTTEISELYNSGAGLTY